MFHTRVISNHPPVNGTPLGGPRFDRRFDYSRVGRDISSPSAGCLSVSTVVKLGRLSHKPNPCFSSFRRRSRLRRRRRRPYRSPCREAGKRTGHRGTRSSWTSSRGARLCADIFVCRPCPPPSCACRFVSSLPLRPPPGLLSLSLSLCIPVCVFVSVCFLFREGD